MICEICGKKLEGKQAYQVRYGFISDDVFYAEEDIAYRCKECF